MVLRHAVRALAASQGWASVGLLARGSTPNPGRYATSIPNVRGGLSFFFPQPWAGGLNPAAACRSIMPACWVIRHPNPLLRTYLVCTYTAMPQHIMPRYSTMALPSQESPIHTPYSNAARNRAAPKHPNEFEGAARWVSVAPPIVGYCIHCPHRLQHIIAWHDHDMSEAPCGNPRLCTCQTAALRLLATGIDMAACSGVTGLLITENCRQLERKCIGAC